MNTTLELKNNIRKFRQELGLSQTQLAQKVGTTQNTISSIETGQYAPSAFLSGLIKEALGHTWEECFYYVKKEEK